MDSDQGSSKRIRFDQPDITQEPKYISSSDYHSFKNSLPAEPIPLLVEKLKRTRDYLISKQHQNGYWLDQLESDSSMESEYILLLAFLGQVNKSEAKEAAEYLLETQLPSGGWASFPDGPFEINASVKAYFALKITGHSSNEDYMLQAARAILEEGGAEKVNSFTRYYMALLGVIGYHQCPAIPPEMILSPRWLPFNIYKMSAWSRSMIIPLSLIWANRPVKDLKENCKIDEIFRFNPEDLSSQISHPEKIDSVSKESFFNWHKIFNRVDLTLKFLDRFRIRPLRQIAIKRARKWMLPRLENNDGMGTMFSSMNWSIIALKCLDFKEDSPEFIKAMSELDNVIIRDRGTIRVQPFKSPVADTALTTMSLYESGVPTSHPTIRKSVQWLISQEIKSKGDWSKSNPGHEPSGWPSEFNNQFNPDINQTSNVLMTLCRCLPEGGDWSADFLLGNWSPHEDDKDTAAVIVTKSDSIKDAYQQVESIQPQLLSIWRGLRWILAMQNKDGGWGRFDKNNHQKLFTKVPFGDHKAINDPSTVDITAKNLELFADLNLAFEHPAVQQALAYVWENQESDGSWYGRWGVNYIYGTWQSLTGLSRIGIPLNHPRIRLAINWLKSVQQRNGGWGETPESYENPKLKGQGPTSPSQTAWAILGLIATGEVNSPEVVKGIEYLIDTQKENGTWDEPHFTGTGFPKSFYFKYHMYSIHFPLMALSRYQQKVV